MLALSTPVAFMLANSFTDLFSHAECLQGKLQELYFGRKSMKPCSVTNEFEQTLMKNITEHTQKLRH